ncbi:MAG: flavodoxin domain-containing protein [Veillonellaceae bacterium]|nr:flavodoxin domain-containing protein [Veillonellaceae bacterium]
MRVAIVYWTYTGNTETMAEEIALGVRDAGADVLLVTYADTTPTDISGYDRILLGCPAMGIEELEEDEVQPFYRELVPQLRGKELGLFGSCGWSHGEWLQKWAKDAHEAGAQFLAAPLRCQGSPDDDGLAACREFGRIYGTEYPAE